MEAIDWFTIGTYVATFLVGLFTDLRKIMEKK